MANIFDTLKYVADRLRLPFMQIKVPSNFCDSDQELFCDSDGALLHSLIDQDVFIDYPIFVSSAPFGIKSDHIVINYIAQNIDDQLSRNIVNINLYINKVASQHDTVKMSEFIEAVKKVIVGSGKGGERLGYYAFQSLSEPTIFDLENTNFSIVNIRINSTNKK